MRDAMGDRPRLTGSGSGDHADRLAGGRDDLALFGIESLERI
jgi:hypothetical protein